MDLSIANKRAEEMDSAVQGVVEKRKAEMWSRIWDIWDGDSPTEHKWGLEAGVVMLREHERNLSNDVTWEAVKDSLDDAKRRREQMSSPGFIHGEESEILRRFPLLEERRWEYMIPDSAWSHWPVYDRVLIVQTSDVGVRLHSESSLYIPEITQDAEHSTSSEGVIISAGLRALDHAKHHGWDVGHKVSFIANFLFKRRYAFAADGSELHAGVLRSGDIIGSAELGRYIHEGSRALIYNKETGEHELHVDGHPVFSKNTTPHQED